MLESELVAKGDANAPERCDSGASINRVAIFVMRAMPRRLSHCALLSVFVLGAATANLRAEGFELSRADGDKPIELAAPRAPRTGEIATLSVTIDARGLGGNGLIVVHDARDGRHLATITPFGTRARQAESSTYTMALDEAVASRLRERDGRIALTFRVEGGDPQARVRIHDAMIGLETRNP